MSLFREPDGNTAILGQKNKEPIPAILMRPQGFPTFFLLFFLLCVMFFPPAPATAASVKTVRASGVELVDFTDYPEYGITHEKATDLAMAILRSHRYQLTVDQLHQVADRLTLYLREAGFQFSYAFLPEQNLAFGVLKIQFVEGRLADIQVMDSDSTAVVATLKNAFSDLMGKPLYGPAVENRVRELKASRGIDFFAYFSRGKQPGEARLNLRVNRFDRWQTSVRADNYGSPATGQQRLILQTRLLSPLHRLDSLSLGAMVTRGDEDESNTYGYLAYETPLWNRHNRLQLSLGNNLFEVGGDFTDLQLEGDATIARLGFAFHNWRLAGIYKDTDFSSALSDPLLDQQEEVTAAELGWMWQHQNRSEGQYLGLDVALVSGEYEIASLETVSDDFTRLDLTASLETLTGPGKRNALLWRWNLRGQYTDNALPTSEQASFSGAYGIRAIEAGFFAADRLALMSLEMRLPNLFVPDSKGCCRWTPLLVLDAGYGEKLLEDVAFDRVDAWGAGLGMEFYGWQSVTARLLALESQDTETQNGVTATSMDLLMDVTVTF